MSSEERQILEEIRENQRVILAALQRGGLLPSPAPPRVKGERSVLEIEEEARRMSAIYDTEGPAAFKAAMKKRNEEARARSRRRAAR